MPETWPVGVPNCFVSDTLAVSLPDGRIRTQTEVGPGKVRRRSTAAIGKISGQLVMTYAQLATFETFVDTTLDGGALSFTFPSQRGGSDLEVRFDEMPSWARHGQGHVLVNVKLDILP